MKFIPHTRSYLLLSGGTLRAFSPLHLSLRFPHAVLTSSRDAVSTPKIRQGWRADSGIYRNPRVAPRRSPGRRLRCAFHSINFRLIRPPVVLSNSGGEGVRTLSVLVETNVCGSLNRTDFLDEIKQSAVISFDKCIGLRHFKKYGRNVHKFF